MAGDEGRDQYFGLAEILRVIRRRWRWVAVTTVIVTALVLVLSLRQEPQYVAQARLLLRTVADDTLLISDPNAQVPFFADRQLQNELQVIQSIDVRRAVDAAYDGKGPVGEVRAEATGIGTDAVVLSVTASEPDEAAKIVNLYAQEYLNYTQGKRLDAIEAANAEIQDRLSSISDKRAEIAAPLVDLQARIAADPDNVDLEQQLAALQLDLKPQLDALDDQRSLYLRTQESLALSEGLTPQATAQVLSTATPPSQPVSPRPLRDGIIGVMLGLGLGLALAFARHFLDQSIRSSDDLERAVNGRYPILGVIPEASGKEAALLSGPAALPPAMAEAYRALRTSVRFAELDRPMRIIQVTSPSPGEGKTTTAANLARVLTQAGHRVAAACCDLRRPAIHELFGVPVSPGLADVIVDECTLADAITPADELIYVLPGGTRPPNPSELLGSSRAERAIGALAAQTDYTILDTTPILPVTDAIVVSRLADATLVVVQAGKTTRGQLQQALGSLELASAPVLGLVLNRAAAADRYAYTYDQGRDVAGAARAATSDGAARHQSPVG